MHGQAVDAGAPATAGAEEPREDELRRLLGAVSDGLARVRDGALVWVNAPLARLAGAEHPKHLLGRPFSSLFAGGSLPDWTAGRVEALLERPEHDPLPVAVEPVPGAATEPALAARVIELGSQRTLEAEVMRSDGALRAANREIVDLRERLRHESTQREELLTVVSHELRTPVTVIAGYNRLLLSEKVGPLSERQRHFVEESQKSCQRLNAFIGNLLERAREASVVGPLEVAEAPIREPIEAVVGLLQPLLRDQRVSVSLDLPAELPRARFDPPRIEQVLTNLLGNALKFAPAGGDIEIAARTARVERRVFVEVSVGDRGEGVAPADRERIFDAYVQAGDQSRAGGLGLGLAICKRIIEAHGGVIHVGDRPGGGSRFTFRIPAAEEGR